MKRLTDKNHNAVNRCGEYSSCYSCNREKCYISELADKLGEFEAFMEEQGFEDLQDLERYIEQSIKAIELLDKKMKENQTLKDRWEKLKEYVADNLEITQVCQDPIEQEEYWCLIGAENCYKNLQEKIQELEE